VREEGSADGEYLHYWFVESESDPAKDPVGASQPTPSRPPPT
jgi:hypothetical protein